MCAILAPRPKDTEGQKRVVKNLTASFPFLAGVNPAANTLFLLIPSPPRISSALYTLHVAVHGG